MDWLDLLKEIFEVCIIPLLGVLTTWLIKMVQVKKAEIIASTEDEMAQKYISLLAQTIEDCVRSTNQTYVEALKNQNQFTAAAQKTAFTKTYNAVMSLLSVEAKKYLYEIYGDLPKYVTTKIESAVNTEKK